ncbi:zeta toxin family protein [bacterium]|nr:zeta toxin family protein [bacterium]
MKPQLVLIAGPNGAGKSTIAPTLLKGKFRKVEFVNADSIAQGLSAFRPETVAFEAGRSMLKRLHALANDQKDIAFESTLASQSYARWIEQLQEKGYRFYLIFLWLESTDLAIQRVRERVKAGGHDVPEAMIRRRYTRGIKNFLNLYLPLANTWAIYDNSGKEPVLIAAGGKKQKTKIFKKELWRIIQETGK